MQTLQLDVAQGSLFSAPHVQARFQQLRAEFMDRAAKELSEAVTRNIQTSAIGNPYGARHRLYDGGEAKAHVAARQAVYRGSGGGYVAVRPVADGSGPKSAGAITTYLEDGHKNRLPTGRNQRYVPQINCARARAFQFYKQARPDVERLEREGAERLETELAAALEGAR